MSANTTTTWYVNLKTGEVSDSQTGPSYRSLPFSTKAEAYARAAAVLEQKANEAKEEAKREERIATLKTDLEQFSKGQRVSVGSRGEGTIIDLDFNDPINPLKVWLDDESDYEWFGLSEVNQPKPVSKFAFKRGDKVRLVEGAEALGYYVRADDRYNTFIISEVDEDDDRLPYYLSKGEGQPNICWVHPEDVVPAELPIGSRVKLTATGPLDGSYGVIARRSMLGNYAVTLDNGRSVTVTPRGLMPVRAAETPFKVGDRVRLKQGSRWGEDTAKKVGIVQSITSSSHFGPIAVAYDGKALNLGDGEYWHFRADELQPATKFSVGQQVRANHFAGTDSLADAVIEQVLSDGTYRVLVANCCHRTLEESEIQEAEFKVGDVVKSNTHAMFNGTIRRFEGDVAIVQLTDGCEDRIKRSELQRA